MEGSHITIGGWRPRETIGETIKKNLEINEFDRNMIEYYDVVWFV